MRSFTVIAERLDGLLGGGPEVPSGTTVAHHAGSSVDDYPSGRGEIQA